VLHYFDPNWSSDYEEEVEYVKIVWKDGRRRRTDEQKSSSQLSAQVS
jgi:hypothetical protein